MGGATWLDEVHTIQLPPPEEPPLSRRRMAPSQPGNRIAGHILDLATPETEDSTYETRLPSWSGLKKIGFTLQQSRERGKTFDLLRRVSPSNPATVVLRTSRTTGGTKTNPRGSKTRNRTPTSAKSPHYLANRRWAYAVVKHRPPIGLATGRYSTQSNREDSIETSSFDGAKNQNGGVTEARGPSGGVLTCPVESH